MRELREPILRCLEYFGIRVTARHTACQLFCKIWKAHEPNTYTNQHIRPFNDCSFNEYQSLKSFSHKFSYGQLSICITKCFNSNTTPRSHTWNVFIKCNFRLRFVFSSLRFYNVICHKESYGKRFVFTNCIIFDH